MSNAHPEAEHSFDTAYQTTADMYGMPYQELRDYFTGRPIKGTVLDLGCGQGRDALFLASIGYEVTAVDSSQVGVAQMLAKAEEQNLSVTGITADVADLHIKQTFDVILFDMVLHAFTAAQQAELLKKYASNLNDDGLFCIVFPDDMGESHFMKILNSLSSKWELKDEITIRDIPKLNNEEIDFTFVMICVQRVNNHPKT